MARYFNGRMFVLHANGDGSIPSRATMLLDRNKYREEGYIGEELLVGRDELADKAEVVKKSIDEGYFTFEEALAAYQMTLEDYLKYYPE